MRLSPVHLAEFRRCGFLLLHDLFSTEEIARIKEEVPSLTQRDSAARVKEKDGRLVRSVYGCHRNSEVCAQLVRHPRVLLPAMQILDGRVYVHQFKINVKAARGGDAWEWHQDYVFWRNEDGMPNARAINVAVYLDDVTEFNGPLLLLPGSHTEGVIEVDSHRPASAASANLPSSASESSPEWLSHLTIGLKYRLDPQTVEQLIARWGTHAATAAAGAVLFFDANVVHGSSANMSSCDRTVVIVSFNSVDNVLPPSPTPRPEFLASRDFSPLEPVADDVWNVSAAHRRDTSPIRTYRNA